MEVKAPIRSGGRYVKRGFNGHFVAQRTGARNHYLMCSKEATTHGSRGAGLRVDWMIGATPGPR